MVAKAAGVIRVGHCAEHVAHWVGENAHNAQASEEGVQRLEPNLAGCHILEFILRIQFNLVTNLCNRSKRFAHAA